MTIAALLEIEKDAPLNVVGLIASEGDILSHQNCVMFYIAARNAIPEIKAMVESLTRFANIKAVDGDNFDSYPDDVIIRCEITVGDLKAARAAIGAKP